ncbi:Uncharacterised protein [Vibrio cholerae]|nr:Uncharacterised protein [Vibrio cholerae]
MPKIASKSSKRSLLKALLLLSVFAIPLISLYPASWGEALHH